MALSLSQLEQSLMNPTYVPMTEEEMLAQAQNRYAAQYDANRLAARQTAEARDLALQQQRASLASAYTRQMEQARKQTAQSLSGSDRYSLQRGMQRSSYNAQRLSNIMLEGDKAINDIAQAQTTAEGNIDAQRAQVAEQLAAQLAQYDTSEQSDIQAYLDTLRDREYERQQAANQYSNEILMALYEYGQKASAGGGGSYSGSSNAGSKKPTSPANEPTFGQDLTSSLDTQNAAISQATINNLVGAVATLMGNQTRKPTSQSASPSRSIFASLNGTRKNTLK